VTHIRRKNPEDTDGITASGMHLEHLVAALERHATQQEKDGAAR
jgi:hypothetical protein